MYSLMETGFLARVHKGAYVSTERGAEALLRRKEIACDVPLERPSGLWIRSELRKAVLDSLRTDGEQTATQLAERFGADRHHIIVLLGRLVHVCVVGKGNEWGTYKITKRGSAELANPPHKKEIHPNRVGVWLRCGILYVLSQRDKPLQHQRLVSRLRNEGYNYCDSYYKSATATMAKEGFIVAFGPRRRIDTDTSYAVTAAGRDQLVQLQQGYQDASSKVTWRSVLEDKLRDETGPWHSTALRHWLRRQGHCVDGHCIRYFLYQLIDLGFLKKTGHGVYEAVR